MKVKENGLALMYYEKLEAMTLKHYNKLEECGMLQYEVRTLQDELYRAENIIKELKRRLENV